MKMKARNIIKSIFRKAGFQILYKERVPICNANILYIAYLALLNRFEQPILMQIGANDGISRDPVRNIILNLPSRAILVEPIPDNFDILRKNYIGIENISFEQSAVSSKDGFIDFYVVNKGGKEISTHLSGISKNHILSHGFSPSEIRRITVPTFTIKSIMKKHGVDKINVLQIDAEGMDWIIIKNAFEECIKPEVLHFENCHLSSSVKRETRRTLDECGYVVCETLRDTLAMKKELL